MERPSKKVKKVKKGEKEKKKKVLVKSKKTKTKTKTRRPKKAKQPSMLELLLLQQRPQATGLMPQMPPQMPINPAMIGNIRDRITNLQKSSGSVVNEWVKLKEMLNDAKTAYSNGTLDENDIEEIFKQAKKLGKSGLKTYQDILTAYTTAKGAYDYFVRYLNRHTPEGERNFQPPSPPPQPDNQAPDNQPPSSSPSPPSPPSPPTDNQPPSPPPPDVPQSNTNYFYNKASEALNAINPLGSITGVEGGLFIGALGTGYGIRNLMSRNRLNRDIVENQQRGGRLAQQIQETAVQGLGNAVAEAIPRAGINTLQNIQNRVGGDVERLNQVRERLQQSNIQRQADLARSEAQRQLRQQQTRPSLREANRERLARQNLGEAQNARLNLDLERVDSAGASSERWGEGTRKIKTAEEKARDVLKRQEVKRVMDEVKQQIQEKEEREQQTASELRQRLEGLRPQPIDTTPPVSRQQSIEEPIPVEFDPNFSERLQEYQQRLGTPTDMPFSTFPPFEGLN